MKTQQSLLNGLMVGVFLICFAVGAVLMPGQIFAQPVVDDFNDNVKNKVLWGPDIRVGKGVVTERNHRLEYTVSTPGRSEDYAIRDLIASQGTYTENWEVQIDAFNGTRTSGSKGSSVGMEIFRCDNRADYEVYGELYAASGGKTFYGEIWSPDGWDEVQTADLSGNLPLKSSIRISFDSTTKVITLDYDTGGGWIQFGSFGISAAGGGDDYNLDWSMGDSDQFCIDVYGWSEDMIIGSGKIYADNFQATGVTAPVATRVLQPDGVAPVPANDLCPVSWEAPLVATQFKLEYSMDNGATWKAMVPGLIPGRSYDWQVPVPPINKRNCLVKITGYNQDGVKIGKDLSAPFTIEVASITAPVEGEVVPKGPAGYNVGWITNGLFPKMSSAQVFYTLGSTGIWKKAAGAMVDPFSNFNWDVPSPARPIEAKLKVVFKDASGNKVATAISSVFRIE